MYHFTDSPMILSGGYLLLLVSREVFVGFSSLHEAVQCLSNRIATEIGATSR